MKLIDLTDDYVTGDLDTVNYTHIRIVRWLYVDDAGGERLTIRWCRGTVVDDVFVNGKQPAQQHKLGSTQMTAFKSLISGDGEARADSYRKGLYQQLINDDVVVGTIVTVG